MIKFAVISFPGTNCENESVRAFKRNGMEAEVVLWNDPGMLSESRCSEFDGYCIAGGFSYEDRGRSGIVAAQNPIMKIITKEADRGKVVLGICNGAQVLVETGLIPGFDHHELGMALAWNEMKIGDRIMDTGFYNIWCTLKNAAPKQRSAFNDFDELLHIPIAHGEGRFVMPPETLKKLEENNQILFKYCDASGTVDSHFPVTPNGAMASAAAICNPAGNVMGIMPHPERDPKGHGNLIFQSVKRWIEHRAKASYTPLGDYSLPESMLPMPSPDIAILVRLIITDNIERTLEETLIRNGLNLHLDRYEYYGLTLTQDLTPEEAVSKIMATGELANFHKHLVFIRTKEGFFTYDPQHGLQRKDFSFDHALMTADKQDYVGQSKKEAINMHAGPLVASLQYGTLWNLNHVNTEIMQKVINSRILYNPYSMVLMKAV